MDTFVRAIATLLEDSCNSEELFEHHAALANTASSRIDGKAVVHSYFQRDKKIMRFDARNVSAESVIGR